MVYHGTYRDGKIELDGDAALPEGVRVRVEAEDRPSEDRGTSPPGEGEGGETLLEHLGSWVGAIKGGPADGAAQHDHYIYGTPKR